MKLLALEIEGYGVWSGLKLQRMSDGLNVVYGPNEAGKSTLLHFIRSALYGFSPDRRRYLPPLHGGRPGGWLEVSGAGGQFQIARYASADGNPRLDETLITAADGARPERAGREDAAGQHRRGDVQQRLRRQPQRDAGAGHAQRHAGGRRAL